jgi:hypothetical protein
LSLASPIRLETLWPFHRCSSSQTVSSLLLHPSTSLVKSKSGPHIQSSLSSFFQTVAGLARAGLQSAQPSIFIYLQLEPGCPLDVSTTSSTPSDLVKCTVCPNPKAPYIINLALGPRHPYEPKWPTTGRLSSRSSPLLRAAGSTWSKSTAMAEWQVDVHCASRRREQCYSAPRSISPSQLGRLECSRWLGHYSAILSPSSKARRTILLGHEAHR